MFTAVGRPFDTVTLSLDLKLVSTRCCKLQCCAGADHGVLVIWVGRRINHRSGTGWLSRQALRPPLFMAARCVPSSQRHPPATPLPAPVPCVGFHIGPGHSLRRLASQRALPLSTALAWCSSWRLSGGASEAAGAAGCCVGQSC
jgi:hypothetical protein